jgi:hypothetical protein
LWFGYRGRVTVTSPAHCQSQSDLKHRHVGDLQLECALLNLSRATGRAGQPSPRRLGPHRPRAGADGHPGHVPCRPPAACPGGGGFDVASLSAHFRVAKSAAGGPPSDPTRGSTQPSTEGRPLPEPHSRPGIRPVNIVLGRNLRATRQHGPPPRYHRHKSSSIGRANHKTSQKTTTMCRKPLSSGW